MSYALLTITDRDSIVRLYDMAYFEDKELIPTTMLLNNSSMTIVVYSDKERGIYAAIKDVLKKSAAAKRINVFFSTKELKRREEYDK